MHSFVVVAERSHGGWNIVFVHRYRRRAIVVARGIRGYGARSQAKREAEKILEAESLFKRTGWMAQEVDTSRLYYRRGRDELSDIPEKVWQSRMNCAAVMVRLGSLSPDTADGRGRSLLTMACRSSKAANFVKHLARLGADVNATKQVSLFIIRSNHFSFHFFDFVALSINTGINSW
jgi:hypothetical protein